MASGLLVVADTTPLNYLLRLDAIDLLQALFERVLIPAAVLGELTHPNAPPAVVAWTRALPGWIEVADARLVDPALAQTLDAGEREAISIAIERRADLLLIDEIAGRKAAQQRGVPVAGTLAVLLQASLQFHLDLPSLLAQLRALGFRMSTELETATLSRFRAAQGLR